ncbi:unnamed protein product, partial [marine sediment metagenome]
MAAGGSVNDLAAFAQLMGGWEASRAHKREARDIRKQAAREVEESREEARRERIEGRKFGARQRLAFLKSGVSLKGSPLLAVAETEKEVATRSDRI